MVTWQEARRIISETVGARSAPAAAESLPLDESLDRVLAETIFSDRDYPPFNRSTRDGYAARSGDLTQPPSTLRLGGEVRAGQCFPRAIESGECISIMTGAPIPEGAETVVMREFTRSEAGEVTFERIATSGENIVPRGREAKKGQRLIEPGMRLSYAQLALAAQTGHAPIRVHERPRVGILSTGDEVIAYDQDPGPFQIRNSNSISLALLTRIFGAEPVVLGNAADDCAALREGIEHGLEEDALVLSGGVSMGKYDLVEEVLAELGAEFFFDAVAIRPGRPAVFAYCHGKPVFGLPGNPLSTMVTFELLVQPALDILSGAEPRSLPLVGARMSCSITEKPGMAHFVPGRLHWQCEEPVVDALTWHGSGDLGAWAGANCILYVPSDRPNMGAGEWATVLPRRGAF